MKNIMAVLVMSIFIIPRKGNGSVYHKVNSLEKQLTWNQEVQ